MCGISGEVSRRQPTVDVVRRMADTQTHRGPDASAVRQWSQCVLGHNRLRIIDLSPGADQPMTNEDETVWVVFNGEIYNFIGLRAELVTAGHTFQTHTDTEELVHLYEEHGPAMVEWLRGMFAFAIWDDRAHRLLLARDRLGMKPLYYRRDGHKLRFASEVRALRTASDSLDSAALGACLRLGWVPGPSTIIAGIEELPPGHLLEWQDGEVQLRRWWQAPHRDSGGVEADREPLADVLVDAFRRHLVADVPVGLFLSSGVDSLALGYLAARAGADLTGYTVAFDTGPGEAREAASVARHLGLAHETITVSGAQVLAELPRIVADLAQPSVDGVNTWVVSRAVRQAGLTVALSGLGGDELFAGYSTFRRVPRMVRAGRLARGLTAPARAVIGQAAQRLPRHDLRRAAEATTAGGWSAAYAAMRGVTGAAEHRRLTTGRGGEGLAGLVVAPGVDPLDTVTQMELGNYLPYQLLRDTDAMSMAHSLEVRVPLLDDAVLAAALRAPVDAEGRRGKARLAAAVHPELLARVDRPKLTFTLPFDRWLAGPLAEPARAALDRLADPDAGLARTELDTLWRRWEHGQVHWRTVWALAALGLWLDA